MKRTALCILLAAVLLLSACAAKTPAAPAAGSALTATVAPFEKDEINDTPVQKADGEQPAETPSGGTISQSIPAELPEIGVAIPEFDAPEIQAVDVAPIAPIEIQLPEFHAPEIHITPVKPIDPITFDFPEFKASVSENLSEQDVEKLEALPQEKVLDIAETRTSLTESLDAQLEELDIGTPVDPETGEVMLNAAVLFGGDSAELSDQGKEFLKLFVWSYAGVVTDPAFDGFLSAVVVEGHTAPLTDSTYESGLPLSTQRAQVVMDYCLSDEVGLPQAERDALQALIRAEGMSNSRPVTDAAGNVDLDASRRVTFRFLINLD